MATPTEINPETEYELPWAAVKTLDGKHKVAVNLTNLLYDEEGNAYLLVLSLKHPFQERKLYIW